VQVGDGCRAECECRSDLCYFELIIPARQGAVIDVSGRTYLRLRLKGIEFTISLCCGHVKDIRNDQTTFASYVTECYGGGEVCSVDTVTQEAVTKHPCQVLGVPNRVRGSANLLHCQCQCGYYTDPPTAGFNCSLCTSTNCCFSNALYRGSDLELGLATSDERRATSDEFSISEHGCNFSANHQPRPNLLPAPSAHGFLKLTFVMIVLNNTLISCLVVKGWYAQTRQPSEVKEKKKSKAKTWRRRPDVKLICEEAEKELRKQWSEKQGRSKNSAICTLAKIIECRYITSSHFKNSALVKEVQEFLGERTSVIDSMTTVF
jgi:hypothetical protein